MTTTTASRPRWPAAGESAPEPPAGAGLPEVSICIPNWNCRAVLHGCLESLLRQPQGVRLEVIVVDNASTDGAAELVARDFPEVVLIRNSSNRGFSVANNQAAAVARGAYLFFLNNDTLLPPLTMQRLLHFAEAHPEAGIIGPRLRDGQGDIQASARAMPTIAAFLHRTLLFRWTGLFRGRYRRYRRAPYQEAAPCQVELMMGAAMLIRRDVYRQHGGWSEDYRFGGEDIEICRRIGSRRPLLYNPTIEITHFGSVSTRLNLDFTAVQIPVGLIQFFRDTGCPGWQLLIYKTAVSTDAILQCLVKGLQGLWRRASGRPAPAARSFRAVRRHWRFLTHGLLPYWKA